MGRRPGVGPAVLGIVCATALTAAAAQPADASDPPSGIAAEERGFDPAAALAGAADETARRQVARELLRRLAAGESVEFPRGWLSEQPASALRLVFESVEGPVQAEALAGGVLALVRLTGEDGQGRLDLAETSPDGRLAIIEIWTRSLSPASCEALVWWLADAQGRERAQIVQALVGMTGRDDLGTSHEAWRDWLTRHRHLPELGWRSMLLEGAKARADRLARRERDLVTRLVESARRMHAALSEAQREAYVETLLRDGEPALRALGTELVLRELERGVAPGPGVEAGVVVLLDDPSPGIRQSAAVLVDRLVPEGSAARLTVALRRETEPDVAAVMLRAFRRSPDAAAIDAVLRWLSFGPPAANDAMRALLSLVEAGFEPTPEQASRAMAAIDAIESSQLTPAAIRLLARLGGTEGLDEVRALLRAERGEQRRAAVDALSAYAWAVPELFDAAEADTTLLARAADAAARHGADAESLRRLAVIELRSPTPADVDAALPVTALLAELAPWGERLAAAQALAGSPFAIRAILGEPTRDKFVAGAAGDRHYTRALALLGLPMASAADASESPAGSESQADEATPSDDAGPNEDDSDSSREAPAEPTPQPG